MKKPYELRVGGYLLNNILRGRHKTEREREGGGGGGGEGEKYEREKGEQASLPSALSPFSSCSQSPTL